MPETGIQSPLYMTAWGGDKKVVDAEGNESAALAFVGSNYFTESAGYQQEEINKIKTLSVAESTMLYSQGIHSILRVK